MTVEPTAAPPRQRAKSSAVTAGAGKRLLNLEVEDNLCESRDDGGNHVLTNVEKDDYPHTFCTWCGKSWGELDAIVRKHWHKPGTAIPKTRADGTPKRDDE